MSQNTKNKITFLHFNGKESLWKEKIEDSTWNNSIVFGKVWDVSNTCNMKIYAGRGSVDSSAYVYEMTSLLKFVEVEKQIKDIQDFIDVSLGLDGSVSFKNANMRNAIENFIKNDSSTVKEILNAIIDLVDFTADLTEKLTEKFSDLDISINLINTTLEETIHWLNENNEWIDPE